MHYRMLLITISLFVLIGCGAAPESEKTEPNSAPVITEFSVMPETVETTATLFCNATDPEGDALTYTWHVGGIKAAEGSTSVWNSPGISGTYQVEVAVSDGENNTKSKTTVDVKSATPWAKLGQNARSTGLSLTNTASVSNTVQWSYDIGGTVSQPAVGADGTIYIGTWEALVALNSNGTLKWSYPVSYYGYIWGTPAIGSDGTIYIGETVGIFYALNPDGTLKWNYTTDGSMTSSPSIAADGTVYVGSADNNLYALEPSGSLKWTYLAGDSVGSPAIAEDGTIYVGSFDNKLYALNPDGSFKWSYPIDSSLFPPSIGPDGTIYKGSYDSKLYALNPDGSLKWAFSTGNEIYLSPAIGAEGTLYFGSVDGKTYALNTDGSLKWFFTPGDDFIVGSPAIGADGTVYIGYYYNNLFAIH